MESALIFGNAFLITSFWRTAALAHSHNRRRPAFGRQRHAQMKQFGVVRRTQEIGGLSSPSRQPPYDQDDYDQNSNLINIHGVATFSSVLGCSDVKRPRAQLF
jgi:hypothetical protein